MKPEKEIEALKKQLAEVTAEFRKFRDRIAKEKKPKKGDVAPQAVYGGCEPCIAWTAI